MASADKPLWQALREALDERDMSVRGLARLLASADASHAEIESQRRKINKWLDVDKPTLPSEDQARQLAELLGLPADHFVRRPERKTIRDEMARLEEKLLAEIAELRRLIEGENDASDSGR